ncbi:signal peptidase I [Nocardioides caeni]|uniref:Signal peptidase I n=1 Tax=Nocardioides caeni TaxID=574700 RepID=A0A4S8NAW0_9ACTN|nr:signal peptidase I [Nocardioides caeni]THV13358.1 signal peptidase I [Nocardioides caeni]
MRDVIGWTGQVLSWLVILGVVAVLAVAVVIPRLAGAAPYTVLTGSMRPDYPPGTLVVVKPVAIEDIAVGDVITSQLESGKAAVVTHRVTEVSARLDGETVLTTQGDANDSEDPDGVEEVQVRGRLWYAVPWLGHVNTALSGRQRQTAVWGVSALLIGYAAYMFVGSLRDRRGRRKGPEDEQPQLHEQPPQEEPPTPAPQAPPAASLPVPALVAGGVAISILLLAYIRRRGRRST